MDITAKIPGYNITYGEYAAWRMRQRGGGGGSAYLVVYDSFTTKPSASVAAAQRTMVDSLVSADVWRKLDTFYLFAAHTNGDGEALLNWIDPGTNDATLVNAPAFVALEGFTGDDAAAYINSNFNPSTDGVYYSLNSASIHCYIRTDVQENRIDLGLDAIGDTSRTQIIARLSTDDFRGRVNGVGAADIASLDSRGLFSAVRENATTIKTYKNGALTQTETDNSVALVNEDIFT